MAIVLMGGTLVAAEPGTLIEPGLLMVTVGGGGQRMSSRDGIHWEHHQKWGECAHDANDLMDVTYGNGVFVAVGGWSHPRVVVTVDGKVWDEIDKAQFTHAKGGAFRVLFVEDHFYMMSLGGNFMRSREGRQWENVGIVPLSLKPKQQRVRDIAFGNDLFVGVGDFGAVSVSSDGGKTWTITTAKHHGQDDNRQWPTIEFGKGRFVMVGRDGYTATSTDGRVWENETTHGDVYDRISQLDWTGHEFFAFARKPKGAPDVLISRDGIGWAVRPFRWTDSPNRVYRFGETYFGVRDDFWKGNAALFRSPDARTWEKVPNEHQFSVRAMAGNRPSTIVPETEWSLSRQSESSQEAGN